MAYEQWEFQDPKMELLRPYELLGYSLKNRLEK
jgi:hypothetical protein